MKAALDNLGPVLFRNRQLYAHAHLQWQHHCYESDRAPSIIMLHNPFVCFLVSHDAIALTPNVDVCRM